MGLALVLDADLMDFEWAVTGIWMEREWILNWTWMDFELNLVAYTKQM